MQSRFSKRALYGVVNGEIPWLVTTKIFNMIFEFSTIAEGILNFVRGGGLEQKYGVLSERVGARSKMS